MRRALLLVVLLPACVENPSPTHWSREQKKTPGHPNEPATPATPPSRACRSPTDITSAINDGTVTGSTTGLADELNDFCTSGDSPERIYRITPTQSGTIFATTANPGTTFDTVLSARATCADDATVFACNDDCIGTGSCVSFTAEAGKTYYLVIEGFHGATGEYELSVTQDTNEYACPHGPEADLSAAINGEHVFGSTIGQPDATGSPCTFTASPEIIYSLTPTESGAITLATTFPGTTHPDTVVSVRLQCGNEASTVACNDDCPTMGLASCATFYANAGTTYYVVVEGYAFQAGDFELGITQTAAEPSAGTKNPATPATPATPSPGATPGGKGHPAIPPTFRLPDLAVDGAVLASSVSVQSRPFSPGDCTINEGCTDAPGDRRLLRFSTRIANVGNADYVLGAPEDNDGAFDFDQCHGHYHYDSYAQYRLKDAAGNIVKLGGKSGFCVLDLDCSAGGTPKYSCSNMGISVGCADIYSAGIDCQWVDVTDVPDGCYTLEVEANWMRFPAESSYANNVAATTVCLTGPVCGDASCDPGESCSSCPSDCGPCPFCGDGVCFWDESCASCPADCGPCPECGNGLCEPKAENCVECEADCGACPACGNGTCEPGEDCRGCPDDCGTCTCGHDECTVGPPLPVGCTDCSTYLCNLVDPYCCNVEWDPLCVQEAQINCPGLMCTP